MIIFSTCKDFRDPDNSNLNSNDLVRGDVRNVNLSSGKVSGSLTTQKWQNQLKGKRVLVLVHGYNYSWSKLLRVYNLLEQNFKNLMIGTGHHYDEIIGFAWPGGDKATEYMIAKRRARKHIKTYADLIANLSKICTVDIQAHSLGNYLMLESLDYYINPNTKLVRNYFLMAPAVDDESIERGEDYYDATLKVNRFYVFHSKYDSVLRFAYKIGDAGNVALGLKGPEDYESIRKYSKHVKVVNCKNYVKQHSGYKPSSAKPVYLYIRGAIMGKNYAQFRTL